MVVLDDADQGFVSSAEIRGGGLAASNEPLWVVMLHGWMFILRTRCDA